LIDGDRTCLSKQHIDCATKLCDELFGDWRWRARFIHGIFILYFYLLQIAKFNPA
jgi:hypothetical protein